MGNVRFRGNYMKTVRIRMIYFNDTKNFYEAFPNTNRHFNLVGCEFYFDVFGLHSKTMENFSITTTYITIKNNHTWYFQVYLWDARLQGNISEVSKCKLRLHSGLCLSHSQFHTV